MKIKTVLVVLALAFSAVVISAAADVPTTSQINGYFEQAKQLTSQKKFDEAIAKAEAAIGKLKELRAASAVVGTPDLVVVSVTGDGDQGVTVIVKNMGTAPVLAGQNYPGVKVRLYIVPAGGGQPPTAGGQASLLDSTGMVILTGLQPGEAKAVRSRAFGCGLMQNIKAVVDPDKAITETNDNNNESEPFRVKSRPCGS